MERRIFLQEIHSIGRSDERSRTLVWCGCPISRTDSSRVCRQAPQGHQSKRTVDHIGVDRRSEIQLNEQNPKSHENENITLKKKCKTDLYIQSWIGSYEPIDRLKIER